MASAAALLAFRQRPWLAAANLALFFAAAVHVLLRGPMWQPDTYGYVAPHWARNWGYAWFLRSAAALFGDGFGWIVIVIQALLIFAAVIYVSRAIAKLFELPDTATLVLRVVFLFPVFGHLGVANNLLTEGLAYPLFLAAIAVTIRFIITRQMAAYATLIAVVALLQVVRPQFAIFYPVIGLIIVADFWRRRSPRVAAFQALILACAIVATSAIGRTANLIQFGRFAPGPFASLTFSVMPLYVADDRDYRLTPIQGEFFRRVRAAMRAHGIMLAPSQPRDVTPRPLGTLALVLPGGEKTAAIKIPAEIVVSRHLMTNYNYLAFGLMYTTALHLVDPTALAGTPEAGEALLRVVESDSKSLDEMLKFQLSLAKAFDLHVRMAEIFDGLSTELIRSNPGRYAAVYGLVVVDGLRGRAAAILYVMLCAIALFGYLRYASDIAFYVMAALALHGSNLLGHSFFVTPDYRYMFYTEITYLLVIALCVWHCMRNRPAPN